MVEKKKNKKVKKTKQTKKEDCCLNPIGIVKKIVAPVKKIVEPIVQPFENESAGGGKPNPESFIIHQEIANLHLALFEQHTKLAKLLEKSQNNINQDQEKDEEKIE